MNGQYKSLADGRWSKLSLCEQMSHIGSEVSRALNWRKKGNAELAQNAADRALELVDFSLDSWTTLPRLKEFCRLREALVDYFYGDNSFGSSAELWRNYFDPFAFAARKDC